MDQKLPKGWVVVRLRHNGALMVVQMARVVAMSDDAAGAVLDLGSGGEDVIVTRTPLAEILAAMMADDQP